ncbi:MAG: DUF4097 family beta strand repeat-containing protein [Thermoanaerobaculaceae bacterium]
MRFKAFALILFPIALGAAERTLHFSHPAGEIVAVELAVGAGDVKVIGTDGDRINAKVSVSGKRWKVEGIGIASKTVGKTLRLSLAPAKSSRSTAREAWELQLPKELGLTVEAGVGDIHVQGVAGEQELRVGVGDIVVEDFSGNLEAKTGVGDVELVAPWSVVGQLRLATGVGSINVRKPQGQEAGRGLVSETYTEQGPGKAKVRVTTGVGGITLRLQNH